MVGEIEYSTDLFDDATMERWVSHWQTLVAGAVTDPDRRLSELPLLSQTERQQVLVEWNTVESSFKREEPLSRWGLDHEVKMSANPSEPSSASKMQQIAGEMQDPEQIQQHIQAQKEGRPEVQSAFVAPRTPIEIKLAQIWAEVLGLER